MVFADSNRRLQRLSAAAIAVALACGGLASASAAQATEGSPAVVQTAGAVIPSATSVEQGDYLWFNLSGFTPGTTVRVLLADAAGTAVTAPAQFAIGDDGNTLNPDGHTYRRIAAPRTGHAGANFTLRVLSGSNQVMAESSGITVTPVTTKVYNTGDHALGAEDLETEQFGFWTFRAKNFTPGGSLTATTEIRGEQIVLDGEGQRSATDKSWALDANGDTATAEFTRLRLPSDAPVGTLPIVFSDGTITHTVNMTVLPASEATITAPAYAKLGGTIRIVGTGWTHPSSETHGSKIGVKINDGSVVRLNTDVSSNRTVWWVIDADADGNFVIDMPMPNGTDTGEHGSRRPFESETFTLRFLSGLLRDDDFSRSVQSNVITVGEAPVVTPPVVKTQATKTTVTLSKASVAYNASATAKVRVTADGAVPTGKVALAVAGHSYSATLKNGVAQIKLSRAVAPGKRSVQASYAGTAAMKKSTGKTTLTVTKAKPAVSLKLSKSKIKASQRVTAKVSVKLPGSLKAKPTGKVAVYDGKKKISTKTLASNGTVSVKLPKLKQGKHKISVTVLANTKQLSRTSAAKALKVTR